MLDKLLIRSYTPTRPITADEDDGTFEHTVKTYFPDKNQPGGAFGNFLLRMPLGQHVEVCGPTGEIVYLGNGEFEIEGQRRTFRKVNLIVGGSGLTPGYALVERIFEDIQNRADQGTQVRVIDASKAEGDILLHEELDRLEQESRGRIRIAHVVSHPSDKDKWEQGGRLCGPCQRGNHKGETVSAGQERRGSPRRRRRHLPLRTAHDDSEGGFAGFER